METELQLRTKDKKRQNNTLITNLIYMCSTQFTKKKKRDPRKYAVLFFLIYLFYCNTLYCTFQWPSDSQRMPTLIWASRQCRWSLCSHNDKGMQFP